jgi:hypothetical protein
MPYLDNRRFSPEPVSRQLAHLYNLAFEAGACIRLALTDEVPNADALRTAQLAADRICALLDTEFQQGNDGLVERS